MCVGRLESDFSEENFQIFIIDLPFNAAVSCF